MPGPKKLSRFVYSGFAARTSAAEDRERNMFAMPFIAGGRAAPARKAS